MAKKKVVKKKSVEQKPVREAKGRKWVLPVLIIVFIAIVVFVIYLQWPNMSKMFADRHADSFDEAVKIVGEIDQSHNISFSQYEKGIYYLDSNPRYPNPFNFDEMDVVIKEYNSIKSANSVKSAVELFKSFRINLVDTERYYRMSKKSGRADLQKNGVSCKNEPYVNESIANKRKAIDSANEMFAALDTLKKDYTVEYNSLNLSEKWVDLIKNIPVDLEAEITFTQQTWNQFCGPNATAARAEKLNATKTNLTTSNVTLNAS